MSKFVEKLNLKEMAEEDIYFAKRDRELIDALRKKKLKKVVHCAKDDEKALAEQYEKRFEKISDAYIIAVGDDGLTITAGHRDQRIRRK
jgi:hypothetical protein